MFYHDKCDKYDYLIAVGCGAVAGIVDIFLVGAPTENAILSQCDWFSRKEISGEL